MKQKYPIISLPPKVKLSAPKKGLFWCPISSLETRVHRLPEKSRPYYKTF